jgi:hypothetical protein
VDEAMTTVRIVPGMTPEEMGKEMARALGEPEAYWISVFQAVAANPGEVYTGTYESTPPKNYDTK